MSEALRIVTHEDAAFGKKPPARVSEPEWGSDPDSTRLSVLLDEIDALKDEIHGRMERIEAVKQAKSVLLEDAIRTEALNRKLTELGRVMGGVLAEPLSPELPSPVSPLPVAEPPRILVHSPEAPLGNARSVPREVDIVQEQPVQSTVLAPVLSPVIAPIPAPIPASIPAPEQNLALEMALPELPSAFPSPVASQELAHGLAESESNPMGLRPWQPMEMASVPTEPAVKEVTVISTLDRAEADELLDELHRAMQQLEEKEERWKQSDEAIAESRKLLEQSNFELVQARTKEELATTDLLSARQELTTAYQFAAVAAQRRLDAEEFYLKAIKWAVAAVAICWVSIVWIAWFVVRQWVPIWAPAAATVVIVLVALLLKRKRSEEI